MNLLDYIPILLFALALFYIFGQLYNHFTKTRRDFITTLGLGFFLYYGVFQLIALPCIFTKSSFTLLSRIWMILVFLVVLYFIFITIVKCLYSRKKAKRFSSKERSSVSFLGIHWPLSKDMLSQENIINILLGLLMLFLIVRQCQYASLSSYIGWDTTYYIGTINTSLYTDTMYFYNGASGLPEKELPFRYALSSFYMNSAVWCDWFSIEAIPMQRYVITMVAQLITNTFAFLIAKSIWRTDIKKIFIFMIVNILCTFLFVADHTTAGFLLNRGYEAKAFCANILILATIYGVLELRDNVDNIRKWRNLFVILSATIAISMSAIVIIPVLAFTLLVMLFYHTRSLNVIKYGIICLTPNIMYALIYLLNEKGIFVIQV